MVPRTATRSASLKESINQLNQTSRKISATQTNLPIRLLPTSNFIDFIMRFPATNRKFRGNVDDETGDRDEPAAAPAPEPISIDAKKQKTRTAAEGDPEKKKECSCNDSAVERRDNCEEVINNEDQVETSKKVLQLVTDSCFNLTQINGQRKLGGPPPGWEGPPPGPGCEVFVGKIPRTLYEHEIYPIFRKMGEVYEIRLMMDFSGTNRGYCFVMFAQPEFAQRAIQELDDYEIRPGRRIGVVASINNCRLYLGQLPPDIPSKTVIRKICEITDDVGLVAVYKNANGQARYALISYKTHRGAAMARRRLVPDRASLFRGAEVSIDWAHPSMFPSNVVEESGICDGEGNVEILKAIVGIENRRHQQRRRARDDFLDHSICTYLQSDRHSDHSNQNKCTVSHQHKHVNHGHSSTLRDHSCASSNGGNFNSNENSITSMNVQSGQLLAGSFSSLNAVNCNSLRDRNLLICEDHCQFLHKIDRKSTLPRSKESIEWGERRRGICSSESGCSSRSSMSDKLDNSSSQTSSSTALFDMDRHPPCFDKESSIDHAPSTQYNPNMEKSTDDDTRLIVQCLENLNVAASGSIYSDYDNCSSSGSSDKINFQKFAVDSDDFSIDSITRKPKYEMIGLPMDEKTETETVNEPRNEDSLNLFDNYTFVSHRVPSPDDVNANCVDVVVPKQVVEEVNKIAQLPCTTCHFSECNENKLDACTHDNYQRVRQRKERNSTNNFIPTFSKSIGAEFQEARQITRNVAFQNEFGCTHRADLIDHRNLITVPNLNNDTENDHARFSTEISFRRAEIHNKESSDNILYGSDALANTNGYQEFLEKYLTVNAQENANQCSGVERSPMPNYVQESNFSRIQFPKTPWTMNKSIMSEGQYNLETFSGSFVNNQCVNSLELPNELIDPSAMDNTSGIQAPTSGCTYNEIPPTPFVGRMGILHDPWNKNSVNVTMRCSPPHYPHIPEESVFDSTNLSHRYHDSQNHLLVRSPFSIPMLSQNNTKFVLPMQLPARATIVSSRHQQRMFHKNSYQKSNCKFNGYSSTNNSSEHQVYARTSASSFVPCDHSTIMNTSAARHVVDSNLDNHGRMQSINKNKGFPPITHIPKAGRPILSRSRID